MRKHLASIMLTLSLVVLSGCAQAEPTPVAVGSTPTVSPTRPVTAAPSATASATPSPQAPTETPLPPTPTLVPPTSTAGSRGVVDWPMFRFSLDRGGYNPQEKTLKPPLELKWKFDAKGKI